MSPPHQDSTTALLRALRLRFGDFRGVEIEEVKSRAWTSLTFTGARHELLLVLHGEGAELAATRFLSGLESAEFDLRGHILADIFPAAVERRQGRVALRLEALTVEEG